MYCTKNSRIQSLRVFSLHITMEAAERATHPSVQVDQIEEHSRMDIAEAPDNPCPDHLHCMHCFEKDELSGWSCIKPGPASVESDPPPILSVFHSPLKKNCQN